MKPGDKLYRIPTMRHGGNEREVTVTKVGRKWASLNNGERCLVDGEPFGCHPEDGGEYTSRADYWPSREAYQAVRDLKQAWERFRQLVDSYPNRPPEGITVENIRYVRRMLFREE